MERHKGNETFTFSPVKCMCMSCPDFCLRYNDGTKTKINEFFYYCGCHEPDSQHFTQPWLYVTLSLIKLEMEKINRVRLAFDVDDYLVDVELFDDKIKFYYENKNELSYSGECFEFELDKQDKNVVVTCNGYTALVETLGFLYKLSYPNRTV